jgi:hypothetical protein
MHLHRAEGFLYTKHPVLRPARPAVTRDPINDEMFGYAYTARRLPRPIPAATHRAWALRQVFGYAYTARYQRIQDDRIHDERVAA